MSNLNKAAFDWRSLIPTDYPEAKDFTVNPGGDGFKYNQPPLAEPKAPVQPPAQTPSAQPSPVQPVQSPVQPATPKLQPLPSTLPKVEFKIPGATSAPNSTIQGPSSSTSNSLPTVSFPKMTKQSAFRDIFTKQAEQLSKEERDRIRDTYKEVVDAHNDSKSSYLGRYLSSKANRLSMANETGISRKVLYFPLSYLGGIINPQENLMQMRHLGDTQDETKSNIKKLQDDVRERTYAQNILNRAGKWVVPGALAGGTLGSVLGAVSSANAGHSLASEDAIARILSAAGITGLGGALGGAVGGASNGALEKLIHNNTSGETRDRSAHRLAKNPHLTTLFAGDLIGAVGNPKLTDNGGRIRKEAFVKAFQKRAEELNISK